MFGSSSKRVRNRVLQGPEFRFVLVRPEQYFGITKHRVKKQEAVEVSDIECTTIDGFRKLEYCCGVTEVAEGLKWLRG